MAFNAPEDYVQQRPDERYIRNLLASSEFIALVAMHDKQVIGGLVAYELKKFEQQRSEIYIYDLAVHKHYRHQGIATGLIEYLYQTIQASIDFIGLIPLIAVCSPPNSGSTWHVFNK